MRASRRGAAAAAPLAPLSNGTRYSLVTGATRPARSSYDPLSRNCAPRRRISTHSYRLHPLFFLRAVPTQNPHPRWPENRACLGGNRVQRSKTEHLADPLTAIQVIGRCEAKDAIPTGARRRRPISALFWSYSRGAAMPSRSICVCAAMQVAPISHIPPLKP